MSERKTILYFHHGSGLGGAPLSLLYLAQALDSRKYRPVIACLQDGEAARLFRQQGIETRVCDKIKSFNHTTAGWYPLYNPYRAWQMMTRLIQFLPSARHTEVLIREYRPVLVHLNSLTLAPSALGAQCAGVPLVWHVREVVHDGHFGLRKRLLTRWLLSWPDEVIYICQDGQKRLTGKRKGVVIYNFVDFSRFDRNLSGAAVRKELGIAADEKVVLHLGGFRPIKGTWGLVQAVEQARYHLPNLRCIITGCPDRVGGRWVGVANRLGIRGYGQRIRAFIRERGLESVILLQPFRPDVPQLLAAADLLVFPSTLPHFARPVMEAGAMARPVVASSLGGVTEIVQDGITGLLVPPGDVEALAEAIARVLSDPVYASRLGQAAYEQARRLFDARENIRQTVGVYERLLGTPPETIAR